MCGTRKYLKTIGAEDDCVSSAASLRVKSLPWNLRWRCGGDGLLHAHPPGRAMPAATSPWQQLLRTQTCCCSVGRPHCDTRANAGAMGCPKVAAGHYGEAQNKLCDGHCRTWPDVPGAGKRSGCTGGMQREDKDMRGAVQGQGGHSLVTSRRNKEETRRSRPSGPGAQRSPVARAPPCLGRAAGPWASVWGPHPPGTRRGAGCTPG